MIKKILEDAATLEKEEIEQEEQPEQEDKKEFVPVLNAAFQNWFADSKVVDENGQPLVCYHGSTVDIDEFDLGYSGQTTGNNQEQVFYFTSDKDTAITYSQQATVRENEWRFYDEETGFEDWKDYKQYLEDEVFKNPHINPCYLYIKNPYIIDANYTDFDYKKNYTIISILKHSTDIDPEFFDEEIAEEMYHDFEEYDEENDDWIAKDVDYDGVIIKNVRDNIDERNNDYIDEYIVWDPYQIKSIYNKGIWSNSSANVMESVNEGIFDKFKKPKQLTFKIKDGERDSIFGTYVEAYYKDEKVGEAFFCEPPEFEDSGYLFLDRIDALKPGFRVVENIIKEAFKQNPDIRGIVLNPADNGVSNFYEKLGFKFLNDGRMKLEKRDFKPIHKIQERFEELEENIFATNSGYDVINYCKNKPKAYRIVYDNNTSYYYIGYAYNYIHQDLIEAAYKAGFYPDMYSESEARDYLINGVEDGDICMFAFYPGDNHKQDLEKSSDGYTRKYIYDYGTYYAHEMSELEAFPIYKLLGEPIKKEDVFIDVFESLNTKLNKFVED